MDSQRRSIQEQTFGAWIVHHGEKIASDLNGVAEFPALDTAAKTALLLSQLAGTNEATLSKERVEALAKAARLNTRTELPTLLGIIEGKRLIDRSAGGEVRVLGLSSRATLGHAYNIFHEQEPTNLELASLEVAELSSREPIRSEKAKEWISDQFKIPNAKAQDFLERSETIGFVDVEGRDNDKLYFNGNLFRRDSIEKARRVLDSLSDADRTRVSELDGLLTKRGCVSIEEAERILGVSLFEKIRAASMYDVHHVVNHLGEYGFVTKPSAFHKFVNPLVDDAFDLAKALVAALTYGMTQSAFGRGRITMIAALLGKLVSGRSVGPATAIGEDYKVLEHRGVVRVTKVDNRFVMHLLKRDIGEIALQVLTTGEAAPALILDKPLPGEMTGYVGPEQTRQALRKRQVATSKSHTTDVLQALRTGRDL